MNFYLVYTESANYAGAGEWFITKAADIDEAEMKVSGAAEEYWMEQDQDQYLDEYGDEDGVDYSTIQRIYEFSAESLKYQGEENWVNILSHPSLGNSVNCVGCNAEDVVSAAKQIQLELGI